MRPPRAAQSTQGFARHDTVRSNLTSYRHNPRALDRGHRRQYRDYGAPGMALPPQRSLHDHRSLVTLRSQQDLSSIRSTTPVLYYEQQRRQRHRAPSPAFSDGRPYMRWDHNGCSNFRMAASSPASMRDQPRLHYNYPQDFGLGFPPATRLPSPSVASMGGTGQYMPPWRAGTPVSLRRHPSYSNSSMSRLPRSPTGSTIPLYYDYSESFAEEDCFETPMPPELPAFAETLEEAETECVISDSHRVRQAQSPFGIVTGSAFQPAELPTPHNRRPSAGSIKSGNVTVPIRRSSLQQTKQLCNGNDVQQVQYVLHTIFTAC